MATAVAVAPDHSIFIAGTIAGGATFGSDHLQSDGDKSDIFFAKLDENGLGVWGRRFGDASADEARAVAADGEGNVIVGGFFTGADAICGAPLESTDDSADIFLAKFSTLGVCQWAHRYGDAGPNQTVQAIAVAPDNSIFVTGHTTGSVDFGGGTRVCQADRCAFLAHLDANGQHLQSCVYGDAGEHIGNAVSVDGLRDVLLVGQLGRTADFGGGPLTTGGDPDIFVARLQP